MRYGRVHAALATHGKWLALDLAERGAWVSLFALGLTQWPVGVFRSRHAVELLLRREGAGEPKRLVDRLLEVGLLDADGKGDAADAIRLHDWDQWNWKYPSDEADATRERKRQSRAKAKAKQSVTTSPEPVTNSHDIGDVSEGDVSEGKEEVSSTPDTPSLKDHSRTLADGNAYDAYRAKTGVIAIAGQKKWIDDLCRQFGREQVVRAIHEEADSNHIGFLERLTGHLRGPKIADAPPDDEVAVPPRGNGELVALGDVFHDMFEDGLPG